MELSEKEILRLCKDGKRKGFELLYKKYEKYIYSVCKRYVFSKEDALDLLQDVFIKIFRYSESIEEERPALPWIKKITINICINYLRDTKKVNNRIYFEPNEKDKHNSIENKVKCIKMTDENLIYKDTKEKLEVHINNLPCEIKKTFVLRHIKKMSYKEISEYLEIPEGTVKTYIHRGRKLLREKLLKDGILEV